MQASSLATIITRVSQRGRRGSTSWDSVRQHWFLLGVTAKAKGNFTQCAKEQGGRGNRGGGPQATQQTSFPGPAQMSTARFTEQVKGNGKW